MDFETLSEEKHDHSEDLISWLGLRTAPNWRVSKPLGALIGLILILALAMAAIAALVVLGQVISGEMLKSPSGSLGAGALIVAILSAPFLVWNTVIRQKSLEFQKEGHITDRISAAVEQLGAEKVVKRHIETIKGTKLIRTDRETGSESFKKPIFVEETLPNIEVRIGGLLSLERIAQDSTRYDQGRDHVRVMEIICAYIRENAPASSAKVSWRHRWQIASVGQKDDPPLSLNEFLEFEVGSASVEPEDYVSTDALALWIKFLPPPREDIQTALNILKRRSVEQLCVEAMWPQAVSPGNKWFIDEIRLEPLPGTPVHHPHFRKALSSVRKKASKAREKLQSYPGYRLDLRKTNLQQSDLSGSQFSGVILTGSQLQGADLSNARLEGAALSESGLEGVDFSECRMLSVDLSHSNLELANFYRSQLISAFIIDARLAEASFYQAHLEAATLYKAKLENTNLEDAILVGANLCGAYLGGAKFENAKLIHARLLDADLSRAFLDRTILEDCEFSSSTCLDRTDFREAYLKNLDLGDVSVTQEQISSCFGDNSVVIPDGLIRPVHWAEGDLNWLSYDLAYENWQEQKYQSQCAPQ